MESTSNMKEPKSKSGHHAKNNITNISKTMCYLLRHEGEKHGLNIESSGFVNLEELLNCPKIKKLRVTEDIVKFIVETDEKGRYELVNRPPYFIRAVQGHSTKKVKDEEILDPLTDIFDYPVVVHGTYFEAWKIIKQAGLNKMTRNCIHFSIGYKKDDHVQSGMRNDCEVFIEINAVQAFYNDIKFFISKNKVILTQGLDGVLNPVYFKKVMDHKKNLLFSQPYELVLYVETSSDDNSFNITQIHIFDIINKKLLETVKNENKENNEFLNEFSEHFTKMEFPKKPFIIVIDQVREENYVNLIKTSFNKLKHLSFYLEYIGLKMSSKSEDNDINFFKEKADDLNVNNASRIEVDLKTKFKKNPSKTNELKNPTNKIEDSKNFQLTKAVILDKNIQKNYILLFLNFENEDILCSIDYILIKGDENKIIPNKFVLETKLIKINLNSFLENLKDFLTKENVLTKLCILCINREDLDYLKDKMKKNSISIPKLFLRNIILLKSSDFSYLEPTEITQAAELFLWQYTLNEESVDKIKILL